MIDSDVITRFSAGDPDAVRTVYRQYANLVFAVALRVLGDRGLAEDATQQAFVQAWRASSTFDPSRELGPWLATIARRAAIDLHRREYRRTHDSLETLAETDPALISLPVAIETVYDVWELRRALDELPAEEAELVRLQHLEGLSQTQIAERLAIPVGTVKSRLFRAHRRLAGLLGHLRGDAETARAVDRGKWGEERSQ